MPTFSENSPRWQLLDAVAQRLETAPALQGVAVVRNFRTTPNLDQNAFLIAVVWESDRLISAANRAETRQFRLSVGSIATGEQSDRNADAMHQVVCSEVRATLQTFNAGGAVSTLRPKEIETTPDPGDKIIDGDLVLSSWDIEYIVQTVAR